MLFYFLLLITLAYLSLIIWLIYGIDKVKEEEHNSSSINNKFSIVIPFRNEEENLNSLLNTLLDIEYKNNDFEVIFVDDESTDKSREIISSFLKKSTIDFSIIDNERLSYSPKKDAVTKAVKNAKYNWIITTDSDCYLPESWLLTFNNFINSKQPKMIVAPVTFTSNGSFFEEFQYLDFLSLQNATIGAFGIKKPFLSNGANLAYRKDVFEKLNGFDNNNSIASGDDVFLLEKYFNNYPEDVHYLKSYDALVATKPEKNLKNLVQQRVRWAAKTTSYNNWFGRLVGLLILLMNATVLDSILFALIGLLSWNELLIILISKFTIDFIFLNKTTTFFKKSICLKFYLINALLYSFFSVYVAFYAMLFNYKWKGRTYSK